MGALVVQVYRRTKSVQVTGVLHVFMCSTQMQVWYTATRIQELYKVQGTFIIQWYNGYTNGTVVQEYRSGTVIVQGYST